MASACYRNTVLCPSKLYGHILSSGVDRFVEHYAPTAKRSHRYFLIISIELLDDHIIIVDADERLFHLKYSERRDEK